MKFLTISFFLLIFTSVCCGTEIPIMRFVPGVDEELRPESHRYDYVCSKDSFPVPEKIYCYSENGKLHFLFQKMPEHINLFHEVGGEDPLEGMNRTLFSTSDFLVRWIFRPIAITYTTVVPRPMVKAIYNICEHVEYPKRFLSCLLQGKLNDAGISTARFAVNSTVGVVGAWDASEYFFDMRKRDEDFGQAFASWGIGPGCYVFLPVTGPCNMRNAIGKIFDNAVDIKNFPLAYGAQTTAVSHRVLVNYEDYDRVVRTSADPYHTIKNFWYIHRKNNVKDNNLKVKTQYVKEDKTSSIKDLEDVKMNSYVSQGAEVDTLKAMFFDIQAEKKSFWHYLSIFNTDFVTQGKSYSISLHADKDEMDYHFWEQKGDPKAPLVLITPGLGAHHRSDKVLALAESLHGKGFAVAAISSSFNWHFMETAASTDAPGFMPVDAEDTRRVWAKIIPQLREEDNINPKRIIMLGYSMGAIHALHIAKLEERQNTIGVDRYLAINPPVDLIYGMKQLDNYYKTHKHWSEDEFVERGTVALGKMIALSKKQYARHNDDIPAMLSHYEDTQHPLNFEKDEAKFLIGYAFRMTLQEIMLSMHRRGKLTNLKTEYKWSSQTNIHNETLQMTFQDYLKNVLSHHHKNRFGKNISEEEFMEKISHHSHMKSFKDHFVENPDIRIVHTTNDFLVHDKSRKWLKDTFKEKIVFFEHGGHLGNLHFEKVHDQIYDFLQKDIRVTPQQRNYHKEHYVSLAAPYNVPSIPPGSSEFHNPR